MFEFTHPFGAGEVKVEVDYPEYLEGETLTAAGMAFLETLISQVDAAKRLAVDELLETYNDSWLDDDHHALTVDGFKAKLQLSSVQLSDEPDCGSLFFLDGDMFGGHWIVVSFEKGIPQWAEMMG